MTDADRGRDARAQRDCGRPGTGSAGLGAP
jgi:hypothetical protein